MYNQWKGVSITLVSLFCLSIIVFLILFSCDLTAMKGVCVFGAALKVEGSKGTRCDRKWLEMLAHRIPVVSPLPAACSRSSPICTRGPAKFQTGEVSLFTHTPAHTRVQMCINSSHQDLQGPSQYTFPHLGSLAQLVRLSAFGFWLEMTYLFGVKHIKGRWSLYITDWRKMGIHSSVRPWLTPSMSNDVVS